MSGVLDSEPQKFEEDSLIPWHAVLASLVAVVVFLAGMALMHKISATASEEPWTFDDGVSIWPTEAIRLFAIILSVLILFKAVGQQRKHLRRFWREFFSPGGEQPLRSPGVKKSWESLKKKNWRELFSEAGTVLGLSNWDTPTRLVSGEEYVCAYQLFLRYLQKGWIPCRGLRAVFMAVGYLLLAGLFVVLTGGFPDRLCIRGAASFDFDNRLLGLSIFMFLVVLFYALDAVRLAAKFFSCLASPTYWPGWLKRNSARENCVRECDLHGWLDVKCTAEFSQAIRPLMLYPFIIFFLLLIARIPFFEDWTWTWSLIAVFVMNFLLAAAGWWFLRSSAQNVREQALLRLRQTAKQVASGLEEAIVVPGVETNQDGTRSPAKCACPKADYSKRLGELCEDIEKETRGAFVHWVQDPAYAFLFIPTGVTGVITVVLNYWLIRP